VGSNPLYWSDPTGLIEWTGDFTIRTISLYAGVLRGEFDLISECGVNGERRRVLIDVYGVTGDLGIPGSEISGRITLEDGKLNIDPNNLTGLFQIFSLEPTIGSLGGLTSISLGNAGSQDVDISGFDISAISIGFGKAQRRSGFLPPLKNKLENCDCSQ